MTDEVHRIGYLRVPLTDNRPNVQAGALRKAGCTKIYQATTPVNTSETAGGIYAE